MNQQGVQLKEGTLLEGKYLLERELGAGGMGQVFLAQDTTIDRAVAIKLLHRDLAMDPAVRKRFETEAKAIARLRHPNCVLLYEFGYSDQLEALFAAFEYVEGSSLEAWVGQQLPIGHVLEIGRQVAEGIHHAHGQKIIHRDLKPDNIMVSTDSDGQLNVKVLDFGIARITEDEKTTRLTKMGQMFGTPPYMSPEQIQAKKDVTILADLYAIGVILYELVEGRLPFIGETVIETCMAHLSEEVPPLEREGVPAELETIIFRCLEKHAEDRYESGRALARALEDVEWDRNLGPLKKTAAIPESLPKPRPNTDVAFQQRSTGGDIGSVDTEVEEDEEIATAGTLLDASGALSTSTKGAEATPEPAPEAEPEPVATVATVATPATRADRDEQVATYAPMSTGKMAGIAAILLLALIFSGVLFVWLTRSDDEVEGEPEEVLAEVAEVAEEPEPIAEVEESALEPEDAPEVADGEPEPVEESAEVEEAEPDEEPAVAAQPDPLPTRQEATRQETRPVREETRPATRPTRESESGEAREEDTEVEEVREPTPIRGLERRRGGDQRSDEEEERDEPASLPFRRR